MESETAAVDHDAIATAENVSLDVPIHLAAGATDDFDDPTLPSFELSWAAGMHKVFCWLDDVLSPFGISVTATHRSREQHDACVLDVLGGMLAFIVMSRARSSIHRMPWKHYGCCAVITLLVCLPLRRRHHLQMLGLSVAASVGMALEFGRAYYCGKSCRGRSIIHAVLVTFFISTSVAMQNEPKNADGSTAPWRIVHRSLEDELIAFLVFEILSLSICNSSMMPSADGPLMTGRCCHASAKCEKRDNKTTCKQPRRVKDKLPGQRLPVSPRLSPRGRLVPASATNRRCETHSGFGLKGTTTLHPHAVAPRCTTMSTNKGSNTRKRRSLPPTAPDPEENDIPGIPRRHSDNDVQPHVQKSTEHVECLCEGLEEEQRGSLLRGRQPSRVPATSSSVSVAPRAAFLLPKARSHLSVLHHQEVLQRLGRRFRGLQALKQSWADGDAPKFFRLLERCIADPVIISSGLEALANCAYCPNLVEAVVGLRLAKHVFDHGSSEPVPGCCALASLKLAERAVNATLKGENERHKQATPEMLERIMDGIDGLGQNSGGAAYDAARRQLRSELQSALCACDK